MCKMFILLNIIKTHSMEHDRCQSQGHESTVTSRSERTSVTVTKGGPDAIGTRLFQKWAFGVLCSAPAHAECRAMIVQHAASFATRPLSSVTVRTCRPGNVDVAKRSRRDYLEQVRERLRLQCHHSLVLKSIPTAIFLDFVKIPTRKEVFIGSTESNESLKILRRRRKVCTKCGRTGKLRRRRKEVCGRNSLLPVTRASPNVGSAKYFYDTSDSNWPRIWKYALIVGMGGNYQGRLIQDRNNNGDDDDDSDTDDEDEGAEELDTEKRKVEQKVLFWHIFMLIISLLLLALGLVLLFGFSPYVRHIITTFPGYHNYGHFVNLAHEPKELRFGDLTNTLGIILIILNAMYIVCQVIYVSNLVHRNPFSLPMVTLLTGVVIMVEVSMINIYMSPVVAMNDEATFALKDKLVKSYAIYDTNIFSVTYDIIAIWGHCCGIISQYDFQTMLLKYRQGGIPRLLQVPPTCCKESIFINGITAVVECAVRAEEIYPIGCYSMLFNWLLFYCNMYSMVVIVQLLDMVIHVLLYKRRVEIIKRSEQAFTSPVFDSWLSTGIT